MWKGTMTLHPWLTLIDGHGQIICTVPLRESNRWQFALVYGKTVIDGFLDDAVHNDNQAHQGYKALIDRSYELVIETASGGMN
jgi:hypothetical protein